MGPMEYVDVVDAQGRPTGEIVSRQDAHQNGIRHRTVHVWVIKKGQRGYQILLQKRSYQKDSFPGLLDISCAGHIQAGDQPLESAIRELQEELSILAKPSDLIWIGCFEKSYEKVFYQDLFKDDEVGFVYLYEKEVDITRLVLQKEELEEVGWYDLRTTIESVQRGSKQYCVFIESLLLLEQYLLTRK